MAAGRTDMHRLQELIRLHRLGLGQRSMARSLKMGRDTVRRYRRAFSKAQLLDGPVGDLPDANVLLAAVAAHLPMKPAPHQESSLTAWQPVIEDLHQRGAGPTGIYDRLRIEHEGFPGSLSAVKRLCARLKREQGIDPKDVAIPVETPAGEVAYVDFGYTGKRYDPERGVMRKSWVFVMVLGFSRHMVAYLVFDQKVTTWIDLHVRAFHQLGGIPAVLIPDNLKSAVIRAAFGIDDEPALNRSYRELARHYGFRIEPTLPRKPEHKGKVESGVKYVKHNCLKTLDSVDLPTDNRALQRWLEEVAGDRRHGTTGGRPKEVFEQQEQAHLLPLPNKVYTVILWKAVKLHRDCHVQVDGAFYSAPWKLLHETLWARCTKARITLYHADRRLTAHARVPRGQRSTQPEHLPEGRRDLRHRSRTFWERRASVLGIHTTELVKTLFEADEVLSRLRTVQAIVTHLETFPRTRAEAAAKRALYFGCTKYQEIKNILRQGLDLEPLPKPSSLSWSKNSRFARKPSELGLFTKGNASWSSLKN